MTSNAPDTVKREPLVFHQPDITELEIESVVKTLRSGWLTSGPMTQEFEKRFSETIQAQHALAVTSCTAALHLALEALGIGPGDEVIVPTLTFTATAEAVMYLGATPVISDVCPRTMLMRLEDIEALVTEKTKAIMPVHVAGLPVDLDPILEFAKEKGIAIVEDAAHALPAKYKGRWIGSISDLTCFSFYATKTMTTGEGGMLTTSREDYAKRVKIMRQHGIDRDAWSRDSSVFAWQYEVIESGFKYNMPDVNAAIGVAQLKRLDEMWKRRTQISNIYFDILKDCSEIELPSKPAHANSQHSWHLFAIKVLENSPLNRNQLSQALKEQEVPTSVHWIPLHMQPFYKNRFGCKESDFPNGSFLGNSILSLPISSKLTDDDVAFVAETLVSTLKRK